jgi:hypothetical protein
MVVFLVPVGPERYQLYVEIPPDQEEAAGAEVHQKGWIARQVQRFRAMLAEAERDRLRRESGEPGEGSGLWRAILRKVAETIAEQRLLWHLRHQTVVEAQHPDDMSGATALETVRAEFARDLARHRRWTFIDAGIAAVTVPLVIIPGPNFLGWYFAFRAVGHLFAWRGARKGLTAIEWRTKPSAPLSQVRAALGLPTHDRRLRLLELGEQLGLQHLAAFVERVARLRGVRPAKPDGIHSRP